MHTKYLKNFTGRLVLTAFFAVLQILFFIAVIVVLGAYAAQIYTSFTIISTITVIIVVNLDKNPAYKLAWTILILTFPLFGGLMYITASMQSSTHRFKKKLKKTHGCTQPYYRTDENAINELTSEGPAAYSTASYLTGKMGYPVYKNTEATYFPDGESYFEALCTELERAEHFIFLEYFIIQEGIMWDKVFKILINKAKKGVDIRLIFDGMGCIGTLPKNFEEILRELGIKVSTFNRFIPVATVSQNNRDHRKIVSIDGHTAFCGGINLADEYINAYERFGHWKDAGLRLRGEAADSFTLIFLENWYLYNEPDKDIAKYLFNRDTAAFVDSQKTRGYVQPYADSPLDGESVGESVYFNMINKASDYVYISTPYLIPDNELLTALRFAAKSGIDVRIITPGIPDKWYVHAVTRSYYSTLIASGVRIYEYTPGFIHSKFCVCDNKIAAVGSINFDYRSLYLHFESASMLYDCPAVSDIKKDFLGTIEQCREITAEDCKKFSLKQRILMAVLKIFAPLF